MSLKILSYTSHRQGKLPIAFADGDVHGLLNDGTEEFVYVSVTTPPINFGYAYKEKR